MADIELTLDGESSGAVNALNQTGKATGDLASETGKSVVAWQLMADVATKAASAVVKFGVDSVKAYAESERVQKQLTRAAGDAAEAIDEQSKALSKLYAVDDDIINQSAVLLTQWGGQTAASKEAEVAALNLASAMGTDLNGATQALIRNVESGGVGLAKMGIHFKQTGDRGKDLEAAVEAINKKLGGAAAADADSLTGQLRAAHIAFEDIQKSIGGSVAQFLKQTGIVEHLTAAMRDLNGLFTPTAKKQAEDPAFVAQQVQFWEDIASGNREGWKDAEAGIKFTFEEAQTELAKWRAKLNPSDFNAAFEGKGRVTGTTNKGLKDDAKKADLQAHSDLADAHDNIYRHEEESAIHTFTKIEKAQHDLAKSSEDGRIAEEKAAAESAARTEKEEAKREEQTLKDQNDRLQKKAKQAQAAGDAIGAAMVNALADQLSKLAEGGEFDAATFISEILAAAVGVAGTVIGTAFGQPAVGAAIGNLAAMGIRAGGSAISKGNKSNKPRTFHDGGWVDAPRHHDGAWIGPDEQRAVLQTGERVLSRAEIHHAGGPAAVDNMARGGPGVTLNVHAIDAKSFADTMSGSGGDGLKQALRRGHGALPALFGRGPR